MAVMGTDAISGLKTVCVRATGGSRLPPPASLGVPGFVEDILDACNSLGRSRPSRPPCPSGFHNAGSADARAEQYQASLRPSRKGPFSRHSRLTSCTRNEDSKSPAARWIAHALTTSPAARKGCVPYRSFNGPMQVGWSLNNSSD